MQKPREHHTLTSDNNIIKFKKPVHDPFKLTKAFKKLFLVEKPKWVPCPSDLKQ